MTTEDDGSEPHPFLGTVTSDELDYMTEALRTVRKLIDGRPGMQAQTAIAIMVYAGNAIEKNTDLCASCLLREGIKVSRAADELLKPKGPIQ